MLQLSHPFFLCPTLACPAAPQYGPGGEVLYAGADPGTGGVLEYSHDLIYVAVLVQALGCLTDKAWLLLLIVSSSGGGGGTWRQGSLEGVWLVGGAATAAGHVLVVEGLSFGRCCCCHQAPAYALWQARGLLSSSRSGPEPVETDIERRRREKRERQDARAQKFQR